MAERIEEGSLRTLWGVSLPLMLSYFSTFSMMFIDRLFLAKLSDEAFSAAAGAGTFASAIFFTPVAIAGLSQIFIAQFNGAERWKEIGKSTWQMIYFALFSILYLVPIGYAGTYFLTPLEGSYFSLTLYFSPVLVCVAGIQSFYLGQGKVKLITFLALASNLLNIVLDPLFIFGLKDFFPALGIQGAALATGLSECIKMAILLSLFFAPSNQKWFHTSYCPFNWPKCKSIIKIGLPSALYESVEIMGWALFFWIMSQISTTHFFIASVIQSIMLLFLFSETALEKGASTIAGNLIGANRHDQIERLLLSCLTFITIFAIFLFGLIFIAPHMLTCWFYNGDNEEILSLLNQSIVVLGVYIVLENMRWTLGGILSAAGDTLYLMLSTVLLTLFTLVLPLYLIVYLGTQNILHAFYILSLYSLLSVACNFFRFKKGSWKNISIIEESS